MSARVKFWTLLGGCLLVAILAWALSVPPTARRVEGLAAELEADALRVERITPRAVGAATLEARKKATEAAERVLEGLRERFAAADDEALDLWFEDLEVPWSGRPGPAEFKRHYLLAIDALRRDVSSDLEPHGLGDRVVPVISYPWIAAEETPDVNLMRALQREFHVEDRVSRALAKRGAALDEALVGGDVETGGVGAARLFDRLRYRVVAVCPTPRVAEVLHAFDAPIGPDGDPAPEGGLHVSVRQVEIGRAGVDRASVGAGPEEPPARIVFEIDVLDFKGTAEERG